MTDIEAMIGRLNARGGISRAAVEAVIDAIIEQKFSEYVRDMQQRGLSPDEIESSLEIQTEMAREWKAHVLHEADETFFSPPIDALSCRLTIAVHLPRLSRPWSIAPRG
jgi:hypothetical protein